MTAIICGDFLGITRYSYEIKVLIAKVYIIYQAELGHSSQLCKTTLEP